LLTRYQTVSSVDLTPLIRLLGTLNQTDSATATLGNLSLTMTSGPVLPNHIATTFTWRYTPDQACVDLIFDNGVFYTFMDSPQFTAEDSAQAMNTPLENTSPTASPSPLPSTSSTPNPTTSSSEQNPVTGTDKTVESNYAEYAVIIVLLGIIATCAGIILHMKRHER
ncbi:MAG: hypothetical protein M1167_01535, partial [Chloroflexi bacterium]|nr:hypothetical protein [Chloroflexota bacterium]